MKHQPDSLGTRWTDRLIWACLNNRLIVTLTVLVVIVGGIAVAPFDWQIESLPRRPVPVDAIPDIGENQQIVFTEWMGRSPQDVEDQISYPLTAALLGVAGVRSVRSYSMFGFSTIYVIFEEHIDFYWSRSRLLEKLSSLPQGTLPPEVNPALGPDATALGQVFWYTLEGRDAHGRPTGGWDLHELRTIQDYYVRYALMGAEGISEVASVGGFIKEYQIDVDPLAMRHFGVTLPEVAAAVRRSNQDVGARTIEINRVEYVIRGIGFLESLEDLENTLIKVRGNTPIYLKNIAHIALGPALRRGALDRAGAEAVGGVAVVRHGENPLSAIKALKAKIAEISPGLPAKELPDGSSSQVEIVPFYDRTGLIYETLATLNSALSEEILVTIIVIVLLVMHLRSSLLIAGLLPLAVLLCFIAMKLCGVDANIVALSGIAIAIGTMVDMGIVICENILKKIEQSNLEDNRLHLIFQATQEVASAVMTAILTTVVSFLPVFTMIGAEGRLFKPLAFTKTFALLASVTVALMVIPPFAYLLFSRRFDRARSQKTNTVGAALIVLLAGTILTSHWLPLGPERGSLRNLIFVFAILLGTIGLITIFQKYYRNMLSWCLEHRKTTLTLPCLLIGLGLVIWQDLGKEFMPPLNEGSFLLMPTTMPHASIGEVLDVLRKQDIQIDQIPEVSEVVGKLGRAETALDPAPISMIESVINYQPEYLRSERGQLLTFKFDHKERDLFRDREGRAVPAADGQPYVVPGKFERDDKGALIPDRRGMPFRLWRPALDVDLNPGRSAWSGIRTPDDIWREIVNAARIPGTTSAPRLQPIETRIVMLQSGMRAPMGIKVKGPDLETIEQVGLRMEQLLKEVPGVNPAAVLADRIVGKPYLEIKIRRAAAARYGIDVAGLQQIIETGFGGKRITTTVEGRERYPVRVRYLRELRDTIEDIERILVPGAGGSQIPLSQLAEIEYRRGPQVIKSEDTFLVGYVLFDKLPGFAEIDVVENARDHLTQAAAEGRLEIPAGVSYSFAGNYENQLRANRTLRIVLPLALLIIFIILYLQFRSTAVTMMVFTGIVIAWAGGFILLWCYGQPWFMNFSVFSVSMRELFQVHPVNLSVAVWVGFLALFGIASDNGVIMATYLDQTFEKLQPQNRHEIFMATLQAAERRVRPCLMTSATTILALIPVLTSTGKGSDIMVPMAIPSFGGMLLVVLSIFIIPVLYALRQEWLLKKSQS